MPPNERSEKQAAAQQAVDILYEIATILVSKPAEKPQS
jgi:mitotic-spindle organizing protein 1